MVDSDLLSKVIEWGLLIDADRVEDLAEARRCIEVAVAGLAAQRRTSSDLAELRRIVGRMQGPSVDVEVFIAADVAFHLVIAEAAGNRTLNRVISNIRSMLQVWIAQVLIGTVGYEPFLSEHLEILAAIEKGDSDAARSAMERHMVSTTTRLIEKSQAVFPQRHDR